MQFLGHTVLHNLFTRQRHRDDSHGGSESRRRRRTTGSEKHFPQKLSENGRALMNSGTFGSNEYYQDVLRKRNVRLGRKLMHRELGLDPGHPARNPKFLSQVCTISCSNTLLCLPLTPHRIFYLRRMLI